MLMPLKVITDRTPIDSPKRVLSTRVADLITDMLYGVVEQEGGTGGFAMIPGVRVGGKTGTAHKPRSEGRGYARDKTMSSFVGFVDASEIGIDDRLVLLVTMEEPTGGSHYGGIVSAPVFRKIMKRTLDVVATRKLLAPSGATALRRDGDLRRNS
jgi:cell division protein FtsI (penicillin-binding protein 3)